MGGGALVEVRKAGNLTADFEQAFLDEVVVEIAGDVEALVGFRNRDLLGNHPGVERTADVAQRVEGLIRAHPSAGDANKADHLALPLGETREIERVLENAGEAAVILRGPDDDTIGVLDALAKPADVGRGVSSIAAAIGKREVELAKVDEVGLAGGGTSSGFEGDGEGHLGIAALAQAAADARNTYRLFDGHAHRV